MNMMNSAMIADHLPLQSLFSAPMSQFNVDSDTAVEWSALNVKTQKRRPFESYNEALYFVESHLGDRALLSGINEATREIEYLMKVDIE